MVGPLVGLMDTVGLIDGIVLSDGARDVLGLSDGPAVNPLGRHIVEGIAAGSVYGGAVSHVSGQSRTPH